MALVTSAAASLKNTWGFSPQSIPGLQLWLDAADTTSITGTSTVTAWRDKSGTARTVSFTGTNTYTSSPASVNTNGSTAFFQADADFRKSTVPNGSLFLVYKWNNSTAGTNQCLWGTDRGGGNNRGQVFTFPANTSIQYGLTINFSAPSFAIVSGINNGNLLIYNANYSLGVVNGTFVNVNGSLSTSLATEGAANPQTSQSAISFGCVDDTGRLPSAVSFSEIILFNTALTTSERQQVEGYLAAKWGLGMNLPTTHPYSSVVPILPTQIPGLQLWLDAADTSTITGTPTVTEWRDKSGNGYHMNTLQPNGAYTSVYPVIGTTINGLNTVFFSAYAGLTQAVTLSGVKNFYWVGRISRSGTSIGSCYNMLGHNSFYDWHGGNYGTGLYLNSFAENGIENATPVSIYGGNTAVVNTTFKLLQLPTEGTVNIISAAGITEDATTRYQGICYDRDNQQTGWVGDVAEAIVFNRALTTAQHQQVEQYLGQKWGIGVTNTTVAPGRYLIPTNRPFYPTDIPGCSLWLDGADRSSMTFSSGSSVSSWNDKSGNGYNFTNNGGSTNPTADPTMGLLFTTTRSFANSSVPIPSNYTLFLVGNLTSIPSSYGRMINMNTTTDGFGFLGTFNNSFNFATFTGSGGGTWYDTNANTPTNTVASSPNLSIMAMTISGTSLTPFFNGTILNSKTNSGSTSSTTGMCLNGISFAGQGVNAHFAEVFLFNSPLSTSQRQQVEQYLAWKWGLVANLPPATSHLGKLLPAFSTNFTPKSVAGMRWWVDGMDTSTMTFSSGSNITQWRDKSGNAYHATGVNSPQKLSSGGVSFNAASSRYFTMAVPYSTTNTVFMVASPVPSTNSGMYYMNTSSPGNRGTIYLGGNSSAYITYFMGTNNPELTVIRTDLPTTPFLVSSIKTVGVTNVGFYNGAQAFSIVDNATINANSWGFLGGASATDNLLTATIYEMVIFSRALTSSERQQVEGHLAWKWGLQSSLPSTHAYAKFAP